MQLILQFLAPCFDSPIQYRYISVLPTLVDKERIERITGVEFPDFKVISYKAEERDIRGEYTDNMEIEFKDTLSSAFYHTLDSMIATNETDWSKSENYYFSKIWGNGLPAPEGEDSEEDIFFNISFKKNSNRAKISYGVW